ncbi:MAG TPA: hypothetical protein VFK57_15455 [Vicinamibacterales bacterium]|nr:hypothetical protein [Vicinamibacterales bacterium]
MKPAALAAFVAVIVLAGSTGAYQSATATPLDRPFGKAGTIKMKLAAGDYRIAGRADERIRVAWRADRPDQGTNVRADVDVRGTVAVITTGGFRNGVHFTIDIPARSDIEIDLSAGDLEVRGVEGSKRVESWAGDVSIDIGQPEQYRLVEASVRAGDLRAEPFKVSKGGLMRSFSWTGKGPYFLKAKLFAGDLTLR